MDIPVLYDSVENCCGCYSCVNICPKQAISMIVNEDGCYYPKINVNTCVGCGLCKKACNYQNKELSNSSIASYAAVSSDKEMLKKSSSGGMFSAIAKAVILDGGTVYGCTIDYERNKLIPRHIRITKIEDIKKIQGTKYVQSQIGDVYQQVKKDLQNGILVLFTGTPCQVDGLYGFLQNKEYDNLLTIDIICHGIPGVGLFQEYIRIIENKESAPVVNINFRDKEYGWSAKGSYSINKNGHIFKRKITPHNSSYYRLFLDSSCYRENCYKCKYASRSRVGDITVGDYWGIEQAHPEIISKWNQEKGISCLIVNTEKGKKLVERYGNFVERIDSSFDKICVKNGMLLHPCKNNQDRFIIRELFRIKGYSAVEKWCWKKQGIKRYIFLLIGMLKK